MTSDAMPTRSEWRIWCHIQTGRPMVSAPRLAIDALGYVALAGNEARTIAPHVSNLRAKGFGPIHSHHRHGYYVAPERHAFWCQRCHERPVLAAGRRCHRCHRRPRSNGPVAEMVARFDEWRRVRRMNQTQTAAVVGSTQSQVSDWFTGKRAPGPEFRERMERVMAESLEVAA